MYRSKTPILGMIVENPHARGKLTGMRFDNLPGLLLTRSLLTQWICL